MSDRGSGSHHWILFRSNNTNFIKAAWIVFFKWVNIRIPPGRSLILNSIMYHWGAVKRWRCCWHVNTWWSLMCQSPAVMCERSVNKSCERAPCLLSITYWSCLQQIASNCASQSASFHDHHLRHLWDQTSRGNPISGLHGRRYRGDFTPETVTRCYFHPLQEERKRMTESMWWRRRRKEKKLESVLFFFCAFLFHRRWRTCACSVSQQRKVFICF